MAKDSDGSDSKPSFVLLDRLTEQLKKTNAELIQVQNEKDEADNKAKDEVSRIKDEKDQIENEVKTPIINFLVTNAKGTYVAEDLRKLPLDVLKKLKSNFADAVNSCYDVILEERERQRKKDAQAKLGKSDFGIYNSATGKYEGGILGDEE